MEEMRKTVLLLVSNSVTTASFSGTTSTSSSSDMTATAVTSNTTTIASPSDTTTTALTSGSTTTIALTSGTTTISKHRHLVLLQLHRHLVLLQLVGLCFIFLCVFFQIAILFKTQIPTCSVFTLFYFFFPSISLALSGTAATDLNWSSYRLYRSQHPGPLSERSFNKWCFNNGMDEPSFKWRAHPYRGAGRHQGKNSNKKIFNIFNQ
ncbi:uncharacterized protein LOC105849286 isoform X2 [Hydra vulgaris]|uniref:uncharacterized protein LOC105849286 isoform X2 n=1 Tax=Hydra vulgaris TaxID=6087 RepID=UPI0032EA3102